MSWYYSNQGRQAGPLDDAAFEDLVRGGVIKPDTMVWKDGMAAWQAYATLHSAAAASEKTIILTPEPHMNGPRSPEQDSTVAMNVSPVQSAPAPAYSLYDSASVAIAALLGSPLAGGDLMARNYRRMGMSNKAAGALALGLGITVLGVVLGYFLPTFASTGVGVALVIAIRQAAKTRQGPAVDQHVAQGGRLASKWTAFGVGMAWLAVVAGAIFVVAYGVEAVKRGPKVVVGTKDNVFYAGKATKEEAQALGEALKTTGYFTDRGVSALLSKGAPGGTIISFVVKEGSWNQPETLSAFEEIGRQVARAVGGFPIKVRLVNTAQEVQKEAVVGRVGLGAKDEVYYFGTAAEGQATGLAQTLKSSGFFQDRGATVLLSKDDAVTAVSFVVRDGLWENPANVTAFSQLVRQAGPSIGGLPVTLRLVDSKLEVKKEVTVQ